MSMAPKLWKNFATLPRPFLRCIHETKDKEFEYSHSSFWDSFEGMQSLRRRTGVVFSSEDN